MQDIVYECTDISPSRRCCVPQRPMQRTSAINCIIIPNYAPWALVAWLQPHRLGTSDQWQLACAAPDTWDTGHRLETGGGKMAGRRLGRELVWLQCLVTSVLSTYTRLLVCWEQRDGRLWREMKIKSMRIFECWIYLNLSWMPCSKVCVQIKKSFIICTWPVSSSSFCEWLQCGSGLDLKLEFIRVYLLSPRWIC